jgi:cytochrome c oxidase cbb3-type subunit IV
MDINDVRSIQTVLALLCFLGIVVWAYSGSAKRRFEEAAQLPFVDDDLPPAAADGQAKKGIGS